MNEQWKDIEGYDGSYQVSNMGRIKSLQGGSERLMTLTACKRGYQHVNLYRDKKMKRCPVHRLVALAFVGGYGPDLVVNHKDENKLNNRWDNLEWCTVEYNACYGTARDRSGEKLGKPVVQLTFDGDFVAEHRSIAMAARATGASSSGINHCCNHLYNRVVSGGYRWLFKQEYEQRKADGSILPSCSRNEAPIIVYAPDGHEVGEFPSMSEAERRLGFVRGVINNAIRRHGKHKGYSFVRKFESGEMIKPRNCIQQGTEVVQITLDGKFVAEYPNIQMAARAVGIKPQGIRFCCHHLHERGTAGGYRWMMKQEYEQAKADGIAPTWVKNLSPVIVYGPDGKKVGEYPTQAAAERAMGWGPRVIASALYSNSKYKGHTFKRKHDVIPRKK